MNRWTRRDVLRSGVLASAAVTLGTGAKDAAAAADGHREGVAAPPVDLGGKAPRERTLLDQGWRFNLGNSDDPAKDFGYGKAARERSFAKSGHVSAVTSGEFDDTAWQQVDLPHDWAVELPFVSKYPQPEQGARPIGREYPDTSIGWYRRSFSLGAEDVQKRIWLEFDGVMRSADIFINGHYLARHFSGYAPVRFDVTDWMNHGAGKDGSNLIVVRCDVSLGEGWFYEGAGIYRHVWLTKVPTLSLAHDGSYARSEFHAGKTDLLLQAELTNDSDTARQAQAVWELLDHEDKVVATHTSAVTSVPAWSTATLNGRTGLAAPHRWSCEDPYCYTLRTRLIEGGISVDMEHATFGVRELRFDADKGFFLNDKPVKIKGTCNHQDHAGVGAALPDALNGWRIQRLKEMGSNALRTSHNCPAPEFIEAANRLGMLVLCETRMMDSSEEGLSQLRAMVRRYRNGPSVFLWSLGNEEPEQWTERGVRIVGSMKRLAHELDPSRLTTVAMNENQGKGISHVVDVQGFNYNEWKIDAVHKELPALPIIGTETASTLATRGEYSKNAAAGYVSAYDRNVPDWGKTAEDWWKFYDARPYLMGGFVWTGFDYRGEPTPYSWPCVSSHFGVMDTCGFPKDTYFYYKAWWGTEPVLHLFPHWNWAFGDKVEVWCHSNLDRVELLVNGRSLGSKTVERNTHLSWGEIPFEAGTLEARGYKGDALMLTEKRETTGASAAIVLTCDRQQLAASGADAAVVLVSVVDMQGRVMPVARDQINFNVSGAGKLLGLGNGDPSSHEPDKGTVRSAFNGLCAAILLSGSSPGDLMLEATAPGLKSATLRLSVQA